MNFKTVQYAEANGITTITLNRPEKRNAISYELIDDLIAALHQAASASPNIVILTGAGSAFCAGMDLDNLKRLIGRSGDQNLKDSQTMAGLFRTLCDFPKVTIAAVNGAAIAWTYRMSEAAGSLVPVLAHKSRCGRAPRL